MFYILITATVLYRINIKLQSRQISTLPKYFHFKSNGNYSIEINSNSQSSSPLTYDFFICTKQEFISFMLSREKSICSISSKVHIDPDSMIGHTTGLIEKSGSYQFLFYPSNYYEKGEISLVLKNPNSYLDSQMEPCLYSEPAFTCIILVILILWTINWIRNIIHS